MKRGRRFAVLALPVLVAWLAPNPPASACSTFCYREQGRVLFGKNYDWHLGDGMLIVNPRHLDRTAVVADGVEPARWTARYGSVTFNQYGRDFPMGGINEAGLVIELMWLDGSRYPAADDRPTVGNLQWVQFQLDTAGSVPEVVASDAGIRIHAAEPLHYLVADREGRAAAVEFLDGRMIVHTGESLPVPALTNSTYESSLGYLESLRRQGRRPPSGHGSLDRFARAAGALRGRLPRDPQAAVDHAFRTLEDLAQGPLTRWRIVYDVTGLVVHFRTAARPAVKRLDLKDLDFSCAAPALVLDLGSGAAEDVRPHLVPYTREANRALIEVSFAGTPFLTGVPASALERRSRAPERAVCRD